MNVFRSDALHAHRNQVVRIGLQTLLMKFPHIFRRHILDLHGDQLIHTQVAQARGLHCVDIGRCGGTGGSAPREDLDHARDGVRAVQNARRPTHDLDAVDVVRGEVTEVKRTTCRIHRYAIDENFGVPAFSAAEE